MAGRVVSGNDTDVTAAHPFSLAVMLEFTTSIVTLE